MTMRDGYCRQVDYLRVSITDRCNERCRYCMPHDHSDWLPREQILDYEEILRVVGIAVDLGFKHFRITGGEPLVRRDALSFVERLCAMPGVERVAMTSNATLLRDFAQPLRDAGLSSLNISLDTLDADQYADLTRGRLSDALAGIDAALGAGFDSIKLNSVLVQGVSEQQVMPLIDYGAGRDMPVRFIELMPITSPDLIGADHFVSTGQARDWIAAHDTLTPLPDAQLGQGPARYYHLQKRDVTVGFISAMTDDHFCETCNKMRLTADGYIRPCLGNHGELDLKPALREADRDSAIADVFKEALRDKPAEHLFRDQYTPLRIMTAIGG